MIGVSSTDTTSDQSDEQGGGIAEIMNGIGDEREATGKDTDDDFCHREQHIERNCPDQPRIAEVVGIMVMTVASMDVTIIVTVVIVTGMVVIVRSRIVLMVSGQNGTSSRGFATRA